MTLMTLREVSLFPDLVSARLYPKVNRGGRQVAHMRLHSSAKKEQVMNELPATLSGVLERFAPLFRAGIWKRARLLLIGAILCPGTHTVTAALRVLGLAQEQHFQNYHRILNRVRWSAVEASRILFLLLVAAFVPKG